MARKNRRKKPTSPIDGRLSSLALLLRTEVLGLSLVIVSVFTLLSLLTGSRGTITGFWIDSLRSLTGVGVWAVPLLTGVLGLWMVVRAIEKMPDLPWQKPAGLLLLFAAYITGATLWEPGPLRVALAQQGRAGGWLGLFGADLLESTLNIGGAWAVVTMGAIIGLVLLTDRLLLDMGLDSWNALQDLWDEWQQSRGERPVRIQPTLPLPSGELPWWKQILSRWQPGAARSLAAPDKAPGLSGAPATNSPPQPLTAPRAQPALTPRVVGGLQDWQLPRLDDMLDSWDRFIDSDEMIRKRGRLIEETLALFGVPADFEGVNAGPTVTQFLVRPGYIERNVRGEIKRTKVKVSKIAGLANDLALALAAQNVRIEAPIPGTNYVGIEVPNRESNIVGLKELMESERFRQMQKKGELVIALGEDVKGKPVITDLARMPHLLIAGATGSGKSVCINSIIICLLLTHTPETLRLLLMDPKMVELTVYDGVPHLLSPVVTDIDRAAGILYWAVKEMERRYQLLNQAGTRDLGRYNAYLRQQGADPLPSIVVIVDEMADLMLASPEQVEKHIIRLAQMARAVGIHLVVATQRPSVDVITGLIKANFPARIAFAVTSQTDSRVILDVPGADRLLGRGDMLFMAPDASKLERLQGAFLSDEEIGKVVRYWQGIRRLDAYTQPPVPNLTGMDAEPDPLSPPPQASSEAWDDPYLIDRRLQGDSEMVQPLFEQIEQMKAADARDALFDEAVQVVVEAGRGSVTLLQRKLRIGYSRASRLVDQLEAAGVLGPDRGGSLGRAVHVQTEDAHQDKDEGKLQPRIIGDEDEPPRIWM